MILAFLIFLSFGSYLNSLGYRLLYLDSFFNIRSFCPSCTTVITWYDNIPVVSWCMLCGQCRTCKQPISWLYPFIELITTFFLLTLLDTVHFHYFPAYSLFFAALIVTIRTDFDQMLISRFVTLYLIPVGIIASYLNYLPISPTTAVCGAIFGYGMLWCTKKIALKIYGQDALGQGDLELLAFIGAFTGPFGCWITLTIGSILGTVVSLIIMTFRQQKSESLIKIPFGSYLSFGAMIYVLLQKNFIYYFFNI